jgi:hypothetical protein
MARPVGRGPPQRRLRRLRAVFDRRPCHFGSEEDRELLLERFPDARPVYARLFAFPADEK